MYHLIHYQKISGEHCHYIDDNGNDITKKVPTEIGDYGIIYDNLNDVIVNGAHKLVADEEVIEVLKIIEEATKVAKEAK